MKKFMNRNDKCFCGSNVKYKNCCKKKKDSIDTTDITAINKIYNEGRKKARFRECHHPLKDDCSEKIISAHSIQNNKILSKIADSGKVLMPIPKKLTFEEQTEYGRKEATVFTGFCKVHDKYTFQAIEDRDFIASEEQVFLHIYRTFVLELHKKEEGHRFFQYLFSKMPSLAEQSFEKTKHLWSLKVGHEDLLIEKKEFDNALIEKNFNCLSYFIWEFEEETNFAATGMEEPSYDYFGNKIQDLQNYDIPAKHIYYTIFPDNGRTYFIVAWLKTNDEIFHTIKEKLANVKYEERKNFINSVLPSVTENIVIKPSGWEKMSREEQRKFNSKMQGEEVQFQVIGNLIDRFSSPGYDLFNL